MWHRRTKNLPDWSAAEAHLAAADPFMRALIARIGPCRLAPLGAFPRSAYLVLCQSIITQQISTAAAAAILARFRAMFPRKQPTPALTLALSAPRLRSVGLSRQKVAYLQDLARHFAEEKLPLARFPEMEDEEIITCLSGIHGIGRWTSEMFLMFVMVRPDVFPIDDLGIRKHLQEIAKKPAGSHSGNAYLSKFYREYAARWQPYRTVACWYLWENGDRK